MVITSLAVCVLDCEVSSCPSTRPSLLLLKSLLSPRYTHTQSTERTTRPTLCTLYSEGTYAQRERNVVVDDLPLKSDNFRKYLSRGPLKLMIVFLQSAFVWAFRNSPGSVFCYPCDVSPFRFVPLLLFSPGVFTSECMIKQKLSISWKNIVT